MGYVIGFVLGVITLLVVEDIYILAKNGKLKKLFKKKGENK